MKSFDRVSIFLAVLSLVACGRSAPSLSGRADAPVITTALPVPSGKPTDRYALANGCFAVQSRASGRYLAAAADGHVSADTQTLEQATPSP